MPSASGCTSSSAITKRLHDAIKKNLVTCAAQLYKLTNHILAGLLWPSMAVK